MTELTAGSVTPLTRRSHTTRSGIRNKAAAWIVVAALAFCIVLGGVAAAAVFICGWGNVQAVEVDWWEVTIICKADPAAGT